MAKMERQELEAKIKETIIGLKELLESIRKEPEREITQTEMKLFMVLITSCLMNLHRLLRKGWEIRKN